MKVRITHTTALFPQGHFVQWSVDPGGVPGPIHVRVDRSGGPEGPWELVAEADNQYAVLDRFEASTDHIRFLTSNQLTFFDRVFYRVTAQGAEGAPVSDVRETGPSNAAARPADVKMAQYRRKLQYEYRRSAKLTGTEVLVFKRRQWGERCLRCTDVRTKAIVRPDCRACWSTGLIGGYWAPVRTYAPRAPLSTSVEVTGEQKAEGSSTTFVLPDLPQLERDDLLVSVEDQRRFFVRTQEQVELKLRGIQQQVGCVEVSRDHVVYRMPVQPDVVIPLF